jgi:ligand-binding sensor domain-containing protein
MRFLHLALIAFVAAALLSCSSEEKPAQPAAASAPAEEAPARNEFLFFDPDSRFKMPAENYPVTGPQDITRAILQSKDGTYWIGSWQGIFSYDGTTFTNWTLKAGLARVAVFAVLEDSKGAIWFMTTGAGAYRYDGVSFTNVSRNNGLQSNVLFNGFEDADGNMWFASDSGVSRYDYKTVLNLGAKDSLPLPVSCVSQDRNGTIWFGTSRGTFQYRDKRVIPVSAQNGANISAYAFHCDQNGLMWIGGPGGLYSYSENSSTQYKVTQMLPNFVSYITPDRAGNLLLSCGPEKAGANEGMILYRYNMRSKEQLAQLEQNSGGEGQIFQATEDTQGNIWFGGVHGVSRMENGKIFNFGTQH